jgi:PAS domain-containing protein
MQSLLDLFRRSNQYHNRRQPGSHGRPGMPISMPLSVRPMLTPQSLIEPVTADAAAKAFSVVLADTLVAWTQRQGAMLAVKDAGTGRYEYVDEAMARFLGRPADEIVGRSR